MFRLALASLAVAVAGFGASFATQADAATRPTPCRGEHGREARIAGLLRLRARTRERRAAVKLVSRDFRAQLDRQAPWASLDRACRAPA
jgi:hypothetical protein